MDSTRTRNKVARRTRSPKLPAHADEAGELPQQGMSDVLAKALATFEKNLTSDTLKLTLAEYLKIAQVKRELDSEFDRPREITITWVDTARLSDEK
jgi:hypothetical protein